MSSEATTIVAQGYSTIFISVAVLILGATRAAWLVISKKGYSTRISQAREGSNDH